MNGRWSRLIVFARRSRLQTVAAAAITGLIVATVVVAARGTVHTVIRDAQGGAQAGRAASGNSGGQGSLRQPSSATGSGAAAATATSDGAGPNASNGVGGAGPSGVPASLAPAPVPPGGPVPATPTAVLPFTLPPVPVPSVPPAPSPGTVTITAETVGTVRVTSGETVYLVLSVPGRYFTPPQTSNPYVVGLMSATNSRTGVALGTFRAGSPGNAVLSSTGRVCPDPTCAGSGWLVTIQVL